MANVIEHKKFICVEFGDSNNNKFWQYTLYDDGTAKTEWGRVGGHTSSQVVNHAKALAKAREKTNTSNAPDKRYTEVKALDSSSSSKSSSSVKVSSAKLKEVAKKQIKYNNPIVAKFIEYLTDVNAHQILAQTGGSIKYNVDSGQFKTPMGIVVPEQVSDARIILLDLAKMVKAKGHDSSTFKDKLNQYLRLIPHDVGMKKINPYAILPDITAVQKENDVLDGLEASFSDATSTKKDDDSTDKKNNDEPKIFDTELSIITDKKIIDRINEKYERTKKGNHSCSHLKLKTVYSVSIKNAKERFDKVAPQIGNIHELYHGTNSQNLLSILKIGFKVTPPSTAYITGKMFGNGIYGAPCSSKALNYAYGYWNGTKNNRCFMFLVDFCCGKVYTPKSRGYDNYPVRGYDSTWAKADVSGVMNDEVIVYQDDRCNPTYLLEFIG